MFECWMFVLTGEKENIQHQNFNVNAMS